MWSHPTRSSHKKLYFSLFFVAILCLLAGLLLLQYQTKQVAPRVDEPKARLLFSESVGEQEKILLTEIFAESLKTVKDDVTVQADFVKSLGEKQSILEVYVPVTHRHSSRQSISLDELKSNSITIMDSTDQIVESSLEEFLSLTERSSTRVSTLKDIEEDSIAFIPLSLLDPQVKLLALDGAYYLDSLTEGALFRRAFFTVNGQEKAFELQLPMKITRDNLLSVRQTGVTALTRVMMSKLASNNNPLYFSEKIGDFLSAADVTHVSNEVSFKDGCSVNYSVFCSDPRFIETLKASGVDVVELTGNHNNDVGSEYNTQTINQYHELGWSTFGGGLTSDEAAKPYIIDQKESKIALLGYNYADSPGSGAIAGTNRAGANGYEKARVSEDIKQANEIADFVIVDVQYWECYSYPDGYIEYPICDKPIGEQQSVFRELIDMGADMVVGTQAHQPQTFEWYNEKPIYYGLGNLYFDQTQWPGTERGIILTHYFYSGKLLQTQLSPTRFDKNLQTELLDNEQASSLLERLHQAR